MENEKLVFRYTWNHMEITILILATIPAVSNFELLEILRGHLLKKHFRQFAKETWQA